MLAPNYQIRWDNLRSNFGALLPRCLPRHHLLLRAMEGDLSQMPNILLYGVHGFPHDLLWMEALKERFGVSRLLPLPCTWGRDMHYMETPYHIQVDMEHPTMPKELDILQEFLKTIVTARSMLSDRHIIVLENIDALVQHGRGMNAFRVLLERFSRNAWFICTTYRIGRIEMPLRSRFYGIRVPLPTEDENMGLLREIDAGADPCHTRNLMQALVLQEPREPWMLSMAFPPMAEYILSTTNTNIEDIRGITHKAYQCGVSIAGIARDIVEACTRRGDREQDLHALAAELSRCEHMATQSKGMRTLLYMEYMLHFAMMTNKKDR